MNQRCFFPRVVDRGVVEGGEGGGIETSSTSNFWAPSVQNRRIRHGKNQCIKIQQARERRKWGINGQDNP